MTSSTNPLAIPDILTNGGLDTCASHLTEEFARTVALERYGLEGRFTRFDTEKDDTFRIMTHDGRGYVLKIANPAEELLEIEFQLSLLSYLEQHASTLPVPLVIPDLLGRQHSLVLAPDGTNRVVRAVSYIDGTPLDRTSSSAEERYQIGLMLGRLRLALTDFRHPGQERKLAWDVQHLPELAPLIAEVSDPSHRLLLEQGMERFVDATSHLGAFRRQVLHNDFSRSNIVVDHACPAFVKGIIDFGDAVQTAIAVDVSTALLNQLPVQPDPDPLSNGRDLLRGYLGVADLYDEEIALIPQLVMGRIIARALLTLWRAQIFPDNAPYILRNTEQGWWQLGWFMAKSSQEMEDLLFIGHT